MVRRTQDIVFSFIAIIVLLPLLLITAIAIIIGNPIYKFQSMCVDTKEKLLQSNEKDDTVFKIKENPRITRVGCFIRQTSIDELPQLVTFCLAI